MLNHEEAASEKIPSPIGQSVQRVDARELFVDLFHLQKNAVGRIFHNASLFIHPAFSPAYWAVYPPSMLKIAPVA